MIQELSVTNFKSFKDKITISFESTENDRYNSQVVMPDGVKLLRFAVILGANASGKSNLLEAFEFLRRFWSAVPVSNAEGTDVQPFLMQPDALSKNTDFDIKLYIGGLRYWYKLSVNPEKVISEELYVYLTNRPTKIFTRRDLDGVSKLKLNTAVVKISAAESEVLSMNCLCNMSALAALKKVNIKIAYLERMRAWIDSCMMPLQSASDDKISDETKSMLERDEIFREYLLNFAKEADFNISNIKIRKMSALFGHTIQTDQGEELYVLPESCQSSGTTRMVQLESMVYLLLKCKGFLAIDEMESSMHPRLMEYILTKYVNQHDVPSQLLVTTHYDYILNDINDIFGPDSVWFTEKSPDGASSLYSLVEFKGLNKVSSIHKAYLNGRFGAIPNVL